MTPDTLVGVPWRSGGRDPAAGLDCWGVVMACCPGVPDYGASPDDAMALARAFLTGSADPRWRALREPLDGCVVAMGPAGRSTHVGIWWRGYVVHATREQGVRADPARELPALGYSETRFHEWAA